MTCRTAANNQNMARGGHIRVFYWTDNVQKNSGIFTRDGKFLENQITGFCFFQTHQFSLIFLTPQYVTEKASNRKS